MEVSEYLVGSPAFKAGGTGDPRTAGSIPVHLRQIAKTVWVVGVLIGASLIFVQPAGAAARLIASTPQDGDSLEGLGTIEFEFDTLLDPAGAMITVTRLDGTNYIVRDTSVDRTAIRATGPDLLPSGNYEVAYDVVSADGARNQGSIRISIDSPSQSLSGGLIAVLVIAAALGLFVTFVFRADQKRRRPRERSDRPI